MSMRELHGKKKLKTKKSHENRIQWPKWYFFSKMVTLEKNSMINNWNGTFEMIII